jgi:hypothetical protein
MPPPRTLTFHSWSPSSERRASVARPSPIVPRAGPRANAGIPQAFPKRSPSVPLPVPPSSVDRGARPAEPSAGGGAVRPAPPGPRGFPYTFPGLP